MCLFPFCTFFFCAYLHCAPSRNAYFHSAASPTVLTYIQRILLQHLFSRFECNYKLCKCSSFLSISRPRILVWPHQLQAAWGHGSTFPQHTALIPPPPPLTVGQPISPWQERAWWPLPCPKPPSQTLSVSLPVCEWEIRTVGRGGVRGQVLPME